MKLLFENWRKYLKEGHKYHWHSSPPSEEIQGVINANTANVKCSMGELACQDMSSEWAKVFRDAGFDVEIHHGTYKEEGHSWIKVDGHLFDPTAGQFDDYPNIDEFEYVTHEVEDDDLSALFINMLKGLESPQERPSGYKKGSLKREKIGKVCCWCGEQTFVGVEHIIPRSAGGPPTEKWNLAWACYPCNHARGSLIDIPPRDPGILNGWLTQHFRDFGAVPTPEELRNYFNETPI